MEWICYLLPALVTIKILDRRSGEENKCSSLKAEVIRYANWTLIVNLLTMCVVRYVLGIDAKQEYLYSFGFATKYLIIALVLAAVLPYVVEIVKKYVELKVTVKGKDEE